MTEEKIRKLLAEGEGFTVEYKECTNALNDSVFETVASFSNRYGGYIILGVKEENNHGVIMGINRNAASSIKKNFINMLNNPNKISPSLYLTLDEGDVFRIFVPLKTSAAETKNRYNLTERQNQILKQIKDNPDTQIEHIMVIFNLSRSTVQREIQEIKKQVSIGYDKKTKQWNVKI